MLVYTYIMKVDEMFEIKRVDGFMTGAEFSRLGEHEQKAVAFYLM
jgi:hypothetical protein